MAGLKLCECGCGQPTSIAKTTSKAKGWVKGEPLRFVLGHATRQLRQPLESRWIEDERGCWLWQGGLTWGYGTYTPPDGRARRAHRYVYEQLVGPIPNDLVLDHLCGVKRCVNPAHLEPVTAGENTRRWFASMAA